ncbi:hypothetical protein DE146DRAFT_194267 [Phaeosphaeria sp. MPI-PUGE-AT-0046c]|nr:hypothetical protein DE146DRAFT_194267 [Phaeosphaeria sp. MPI-PUGE-AT-0046c]
MMLREEDSGAFKQWLLPKLETISDADAEVLADYVIALVTANESKEGLRRICLDALADFLQDNTASFVDDVVKALHARSYVPPSLPQQTQPPRPAPIPSVVHAQTPPLDAPTGPAATRAGRSHHGLPDRPTGPASAHGAPPSFNGQSSRKRKLAQRDTSEPRERQDGRHNHGDIGNRATKQTARRGDKSLRGAAMSFEPRAHPPPAAFMPPPSMLNLSNLPPPPPGPLPFDASNPMAFFAMMATLGTSMPGMPPLPPIPSSTHGAAAQGRKEPCHDYHNEGFCAAGIMCPYEHESTTYANSHVPDSRRHGASRSNRGENRGGRSRAHFSQLGPSADRTNTTLVVEQIPEENCSEDNVRRFFSKFGAIIDVQMHAFRRLAVVKFDNHDAANEAYHCPKAIFDNRFVKVYWFKSESQISGGDIQMRDGDDEGERLDPEEVAKRQAEAQEAFEARRKKMEEADARAAKIEQRIQEKDNEMRAIRRELAKLAGEDNDELEEQSTQDLATLQAEADSLFAQHDFAGPSGRGRGHAARGAYRGRGSTPFSHRGRGRGAYPGRGGFATPYPSNKVGVRRLDNRPRRLTVAGIEKGSQKDEALRQYLVNMPECASIERHPEQPDTVILTFDERFQAEMFLDASRNIPDAGGPLELSWIPNDAFGGLKSTTTTKLQATEVDADHSDGDSSATVAEEDLHQHEDANDNRQADDADMDVADDVDQWL